MGPELDEITWSGDVWGVLFVYFFNKEAQHGDKGARNLWRMFRYWKEHVRQFNKDSGFTTNILLENLVTST